MLVPNWGNTWSAMPPQTAGKDLLVYLDAGPDETPIEVVLKEKLELVEMKMKYPCVVFLGNKNLQNFPSNLQGGIMWLPRQGQGVIAAVVHAEDLCAYVVVLYPRSQHGTMILLEDLRIDGCYLEQISGKAVAPINRGF